MSDKKRFVYSTDRSFPYGYDVIQDGKYFEDFSADEITGINDVIEIYCIDKFLSIKGALPNWTKEQANKYMSIVRSFKGLIGRYCSNISVENIKENINLINFMYDDIFWDMFEEFTIYKHITGEDIRVLLIQNQHLFWKVLKYKKIVDYYDCYLSECIKNCVQVAELIVDYYYGDEKEDYYFPKTFTTADKNIILEKYIDSDEANHHTLRLIRFSNSNSECPISDELKVKAKHRLEKLDEDIQLRGVSFDHGYSFCFKDDLGSDLFSVQHTRNERNEELTQISYNLKWVEDNIDDYATLLNNFIYMFGLVDIDFNCNLMITPNNVPALIRMIALKGKSIFSAGTLPNNKDTIIIGGIILYYRLLLDKYNVYLENLVEWFFKKYLFDEFNISDFNYNPSPQNSNYLLKCRNLVSEIDGILRKYNMLCSVGKIDNELLEISSTHIKVNQVSSLLNNKYYYINSDSLNDESQYLFSDQMMLGYTERTKSKYHTFYEAIKSEEMKKSDYNEFQLEKIKWLINRGTISINKDDTICLNTMRVYALYKLYHSDVINAYHFPKEYSAIITQLENNGDIIPKNSLFSKPEQEYLNFCMNRSEFGNGYDLINKYHHGSNSSDAKTNESDYFRLLTILLFIIIKINDELCIKYDDKKENKI